MNKNINPNFEATIRYMRYLIYLLILTLLNCSSHSDKSKSVAQTDGSKPKKEDDSNFRQEFISLYQKPVYIDTFLFNNGKKITVLFHHYCSMDSGLVVPAKYNFDINKDFITHNFVSDLTMINNKDTISKTHITKGMFSDLLDTSLIKYATLLYPTLSIKNERIQIQYSISIPVTDVGIGVDIDFVKNGIYTSRR